VFIPWVVCVLSACLEYFLSIGGLQQKLVALASLSHLILGRHALLRPNHLVASHGWRAEALYNGLHLYVHRPFPLSSTSSLDITRPTIRYSREMGLIAPTLSLCDLLDVIIPHK
jgi:hypothetical protein